MMRISTGPTKTEPAISAAVSAEKVRPPIGVIGDGRPKQVDERSKAGEVEERWMGWVPW
jgi:predicted amino acid dehydrogenase